MKSKAIFFPAHLVFFQASISSSKTCICCHAKIWCITSSRHWWVIDDSDSGGEFVWAFLPRKLTGPPPKWTISKGQETYSNHPVSAAFAGWVSGMVLFLLGLFEDVFTHSTMACITIFHHHLVGIYFFNHRTSKSKKAQVFQHVSCFFWKNDQHVLWCVSFFWSQKYPTREKQQLSSNGYLIFAVYIGDYNATQSYGDSSKPLFLYPAMNQSGLNGMSLLGFVERCATEESSCLCWRWFFTLYHGICSKNRRVANLTIRPNCRPTQSQHFATNNAHVENKKNSSLHFGKYPFFLAGKSQWLTFVFSVRRVSLPSGIL